MDTDKSVHLNDNVPEDLMFTQMWQDLEEMQAQGIKVIGMLGGFAPGTYILLTPANFDTYYPILRDYIAAPMSIVEHLITQLKATTSLSHWPLCSNLPGFNYGPLDKAMGAQIAWYNAQFCSGFGSIFPDNRYTRIINLGYDPTAVASEILSDSGNGYVDIDEAISSAQVLSAKYGFNFGGINGWEYFNSLPDAMQPQL
ncbi:glycoside hydrolase superfamily [Mycena olivaceomarginata]|nr:glycoside hydrolase superfamily [Mycena olivaceomarginata]